VDRLGNILHSIEGRGYGAYKALRGAYQAPHFDLIVDHVQGDPFAAPSRIRVRVPGAGFPENLWDRPVRRVALADFLARRTTAVIREVARGHRGSGKSGAVAICPCTQQVLERSGILVGPEGVEARLTVGLPARGRTVLGREAEAVLCGELPRIVQESLTWARQDPAAVERHLQSVEDQRALRDWLDGADAVAFVADGSILPRKSGVDEHPLPDGLPFRAPDALAATVDLPHAGPVRGLRIPRGVTLIVGGGFHGKSTLLSALQTGVYDHVPGDGRERVAADATAVKVRAEDGRRVANVDIRPFIDRLPLGRDTQKFTSDNASGSTSQAANIVEAVYAGSRLLLIDEDTSATNFMIRDARMQRLVHADREPITPFLFRVRELYEREGVSSVIVMGGSGDYFEVADTVILMDEYVPRDATAEAQALALPHQLDDAIGALPGMTFHEAPARIAPPSAARGRREVKIDGHGRDGLRYGEHDIDLTRVEQVADPAQVRAIGRLIHLWATRHTDSGRTVTDGLRAALQEAEERGLDVLTPWPVGDLALPRLFELAAAVNRIRD
jgi:predicted ABC-class ATPase